MGRHGEYIRKRVDARWEGRYGIYSEEKGVKVYRSLYGKSYEEVKRKLTTMKNLLENSPSGQTVMDKNRSEILRPLAVFPLPRDIFFETAAEEWLADIKIKKKQSTYVKYSVVYHTHMEDNFRNVALSDITVRSVEETLPDTLSASIKGSIYCVLRQILKYASQKYSLALPDIRQSTAGTPHKQVEVFTKAELARLLATLYHWTDPFKMAVLLSLSTGLRLGELCALKWGDIDVENKILTVKRTVQRLYSEGQAHKTALVETAPKSGHSKREIPLQDNILKLLVNIQNGDKEYIFGGDKALDPRTMQNHFKKILEEAGISHKNFHVLRHTYATNCVEGGADVKSLSEMLGHANVQITMNRYVHPSMDTKRKYADRLSLFYGQICGQEG